MSYFGTLFYEQKDMECLVRFSAAKKLNALKKVNIIIIIIIIINYYNYSTLNVNTKVLS